MDTGRKIGRKLRTERVRNSFGLRNKAWNDVGCAALKDKQLGIFGRRPPIYPANEDTSSFAFRVAGRTNFAVPRSPAATLIVIYDRGYFPCSPRRTPSICLSIYRALARLRTGPAYTDTPPQSRHFFSRDRPPDADTHTVARDDLSLIHHSRRKPSLRETRFFKNAYFHAAGPFYACVQISHETRERKRAQYVWLCFRM